MSDAYQLWLPGETVSAGRLQDLGEQGTYTPALEATTSNPTLGTGATQNGDYLLHQGFVTVGFTIQFGTSGTNAGSGTYRVTLPPGLGFDADWQDNRGLGVAWASDSSAGAGGFYFFFVRSSASSPDTVVFGTTGTTTAVSGPVDGSGTGPFAWGANDYIRGSFTYKTDFT